MVQLQKKETVDDFEQLQNYFKKKYESNINRKEKFVKNAERAPPQISQNMFVGKSVISLEPWEQANNFQNDELDAEVEE